MIYILKCYEKIDCWIIASKAQCIGNKNLSPLKIHIRYLSNNLSILNITFLFNYQRFDHL